MNRKIKQWGESVWEEKIKEQGDTGVIFGSIYSQKNLLERTEREKKFIECNFLKHIKPNSKIIDLGIGPEGRFSIFFSKKGYNVTGVDISPTTLEHAKKKIKESGARVNLILDNLTDLKKIKERFDLAFCWGTFGHIPSYLSIQTLNSFNHVLKKNGYCLIDLWIEDEMTFKKNLINFLYWTGHLIKRKFKKTFPVNCSTYSHEEIKDMSERAGFKIIRNFRGVYFLQKAK